MHTYEQKISSKTYLLATRPQFLTITAVACLLALAGLHYDKVEIPFWLAVALFASAIIVHAAANIINDVADSDNGTDETNNGAIRPFTGGSGIIQQGGLGRNAMYQYAIILFVVAAVFAIPLVIHAGFKLALIGAVGAFLAWGYSAPPFKFMSRGFGELAVASSWLLVIVGGDFAIRGSFAMTPFVSGISFALLVANLLIVNEFPDIQADIYAEKRNLVVRFQKTFARFIPFVVSVASFVILILLVALGSLPVWSVLAFLSMIPSIIGSVFTFQKPGDKKSLAKAIPLTILSAHLEGILLAIALFIS